MEIDYEKLKVKKGYIEDFVCMVCGTSRKIHRRNKGRKNRKAYCVNCMKETYANVDK